MEEGTYNEDDVTFEVDEEIELDDVQDAGLVYNMEDMAVENENAGDTAAETVEERDDADVTISHHEAPVFCASLDPVSGSYGVSGGEDDKAFVWKVSDGELKFTCQGHKDSVVCAAFSHDSKYVATGDMSGLIKVWELGTAREVWSFEASDLEWLQWHHSTHVLFAGTVDGEFWMWKIPSGGCKTFQSHGTKSTCSQILKDGKQLCVGYGDGSLKLWDLKSGNHVFHVSGAFSHSQAITSLDINRENTIVATGSEDATVKLTHIGNGKVLVTLEAGLAKGDCEDISVEAVGFCSSQSLLAIASLSGALGIWDVTSQKLRHQCQHPVGVTQLEWDECSPVIYTGALDGVVRLWDSRSGTCVQEWHGHRAPILDMTVSKDSRTILTSSDDSTVKIYRMTQPER